MTERYKVFAYKADSYWRVNSLLPDSQIQALLAGLNWQNEVFASVQNYNEEGTCLSCPLFFDFDGKPEEVIAQVRSFVQACEFLVGVTPRIFFSGNRGFHLGIDYLIFHPQCHLLVKDFALQILELSTLDMSVYRTMSMFRIPGSIGSKLTHYKIQITRQELMELSFAEIKEIAKVQRFIPDQHDPSKIDPDQMNEWVKQTIEALPVFTDIESLSEYHDDIESEMTPCLRHMITQPQEEGTRHDAIFNIAKFFKKYGVDYDTALSTLTFYDHWINYENIESGVSKVLKSIYRSTTPVQVGCRGRGYATELMRSFCSNQCHFAPDFRLPEFENRKAIWNDRATYPHLGEI